MTQVTLSATMLGVYVTLLAWSSPRAATGTVTVLEWQTAISVALPLLDFALAIAAFSLGYFGTGSSAGFAPHTTGALHSFYDEQLRWLRTGGAFQVIGMLAAFAMLGRFLVPVTQTRAAFLEYFAAASSATTALIALTRISDQRTGRKIVAFAWILPLSGLAALVAANSRFEVGRILSNGFIVTAAAILVVVMAALVRKSH